MKLATLVFGLFLLFACERTPTQLGAQIFALLQSNQINEATRYLLTPADVDTLKQQFIAEVRKKSLEMQEEQAIIQSIEESHQWFTKKYINQTHDLQSSLLELRKAGDKHGIDWAHCTFVAANLKDPFNHPGDTEEGELQIVFQHYGDELSLTARVIHAPSGWRLLSLKSQLEGKIRSTEYEYSSLAEALKTPERVRHLRLHYERSEKFPNEILLLKNLQSLNLTNSQLKEIPAAINQLQNLQVLNLEHNQLTALPTEITQLHKLRVLTLGEEKGSFNTLNRIVQLPEQIGQLKNLERLDLFGNVLKILPDSIGELSKLRELNLGTYGWASHLGQVHYFAVKQIDSLPATFHRLQNLRYLNLDRTNLSGIPTQLAQLTQLETFILKGAALVELPDFVGQWKNIKHLRLGGNRLTRLPASISQWQQLQTLDLSAMALS